MGEIGKFFSFKGRTSRKEYMRIGIPVIFYEFMCLFNLSDDSSFTYKMCIVGISYIFFFAFLPIKIRRFHDSNLSGKYIVIGLTPDIFGFLGNTNFYFLLYFSPLFLACDLYFTYRKGDANENLYGSVLQGEAYKDVRATVIGVGIIVVTIVVSVI